MFEVLFKRPAVLARYRTASQADSCERFLKDCANRGYSDAMLRKIAWVLISVAPGINVDASEVSLHEIESAVDQRTHFARQSGHADGFQSSRQMFIHIATEWVQSLGCIVHAPRAGRRFTAQLQAFAQYLHDERGLSPVTISARCDHLMGFFERLAPACDSIRAITIADLDTFIENKAHHGWGRASLATMAGSLRSFFRYAQSRDWCLPGLAAAIESPRIYALEGIPQGPRWADVQRLLACADSNRPVDTVIVPS